MAEPERLTELEFDPVIELLPSRLSPGRAYPQGPEGDDPGAPTRYAAACMADAGVTGIDPGVGNVPTRLLTDPAVLGRIVRALCGEDWPPPTESVSALTGGVEAVGRGDTLFGPGCCADLADWVQWRDAAAATGDDWRMVWIGHPWVSARAAGGDLIVSGPHESDPPEPRWVVNRGLVAAAADRARAELEAFADRLAAALRDVPGAEAVGRLLAGLEKPA
ncbi:MAG: DUF3039 domain-containing protein [Gemmataceae bacterium]|nr:DUF3039 domain-containing protein [Gemmataceae bacterium]